MSSPRNGGITLLELLVVLAIVGILVSVVSVSFSSFRSRQALSNTVNTAVAYLNEARSRTLAGVNNINYSVHFETKQLVLFVGSTYTSNASTNEYASYDTPVTLGTMSLNGGGANITFDRLIGTTSNYGTISFSNGTQTQTITIGQNGMVTQ